MPGGPAWFTRGLRAAERWAARNAYIGPRRILSFRVAGQPRLLGLGENPGSDSWTRELLRRVHQVTGSEPVFLEPYLTEMAEHLCRAGFDGWYVEQGDFGGADIMLCEPARWLEYVRTGWVDPQPAAWKVALGVRTNPRRKPATPVSPARPPNCGAFRRSIDAIKRRFAADLSDLWITCQDEPGICALHQITVREGQRRQGVGSRVMGALVAAADRHRIKLALTPESETVSKTALVRFYRRFGFVPNKGRNREFRVQAAMVRPRKDVR
jgi:ribosomal protein S18 acetylase RimI-like enzyme